MPPVRGRGAARAQFGLSRSNANSISPFVGTRSARTNFSSFSVIWFPTTCMYAARADSRKLVLPKADGPELQRAVEATDIQRFHTIGVFVGVKPFLVHLKKGPPERVSRDLLNCVADCLGRCGKSHIRYGSHRPRSLPAGEQLGSGAIVEKSHFTLQSACLAARQHIENLTGRGSPERKQRECAYIRSHQLDLVVVSNDGALRHQRALRLPCGG